MKCTFVVGQHVVCATGQWSRSASAVRVPAPVKGEICKIVSMVAGPYQDGVICQSGVWLHMAGYRAAMCSSAFRPLQQRPTHTDISKLRKLLDLRPEDILFGNKIGERVDA